MSFMTMRVTNEKKYQREILLKDMEAIMKYSCYNSSGAVMQ